MITSLSDSAVVNRMSIELEDRNINKKNKSVCRICCWFSAPGRLKCWNLVGFYARVTLHNGAEYCTSFFLYSRYQRLIAVDGSSA